MRRERGTTGGLWERHTELLCCSFVPFSWDLYIIPWLPEDLSLRADLDNNLHVSSILLQDCFMRKDIPLQTATCFIACGYSPCHAWMLFLLLKMCTLNRQHNYCIVPQQKDKSLYSQFAFYQSYQTTSMVFFYH